MMVTVLSQLSPLARNLWMVVAPLAVALLISTTMVIWTFLSLMVFVVTAWKTSFIEITEMELSVRIIQASQT